MVSLRFILNCIVAAFLLQGLAIVPVSADESRLDELFDTLREPDLPNWQMVEDEIWSEWSKSGSASMDLLLQRGRDAMEQENFVLAIEHLTALTDHAPDFAEGFNARATAYFRHGLFGPAMADIERALSLNPNHFGAMIGLGAVMEELGYPEKALAAFRAAHAIHPNEPDIKDAVERLEKSVSGITI